MHAFDDAKGERWAVAVTYGDVVRVKSECGYDLTELFDGKLENLARLHSDFALLVSVSFCLCKEQAAERGVDAEGFASRMGGDTLAEVANAIVGATIDFFPDASRREGLRSLTARIKRLGETTLARMTPEAIKKLDEAIEKMDQADPETLLSSLSGSVSESSESSRGAAPCES